MWRDSTKHLSQLQKQKRESLPPHDQLRKTLLTLNILNFSKEDKFLFPFQKHWSFSVTYSTIWVNWREPLTGAWKGPDPFLTEAMDMCFLKMKRDPSGHQPETSTRRQYLPQQGDNDNNGSRESFCFFLRNDQRCTCCCLS